MKFDEVAKAMLFESCHLLKENNMFEVKLVDNTQKLDLFCEIAGDVFHMQKDVVVLQKSLYPDLKLSTCDKYIGYKDNIPAGMIIY